ncbi:MAG: mechanosensitive ion channel [Alphaproteobacteria bacterium]|nr:mechanosensitive ion channel [Alphaproteobacteria bacterium]
MQIGELITILTEWAVVHILSIIIVIIILVMGWATARFMSRRVINRMTQGEDADQTMAPFIAQITRYGIYVVTSMLALIVLGVESTALITVLGAAALAIAVGLRGMLANVAAGVMMIILRPMSIGDYIVATGAAGTITELGLFNLLLKTPDGLYVFVPNSQIWGKAITNYSHEPQRRIDIEINITYQASIELARKTLMSIINNNDRVLPDPQPLVIVNQLSPYSVVMLLRCWVNTSDHFTVKAEITEQIKLEFNNAGVEFAHLEFDSMQENRQ